MTTACVSTAVCEAVVILIWAVAKLLANKGTFLYSLGLVTSLYTSPPGRPVHSLGSFRPRCNYCEKTIRSPLSVIYTNIE